ncbi:hypothetical protein Anapl_06786, partial [Anas platyrhynchos]
NTALQLWTCRGLSNTSSSGGESVINHSLPLMRQEAPVPGLQLEDTAANMRTPAKPAAFALCFGSRCCMLVSMRLRTGAEIHPSAEAQHEACSLLASPGPRTTCIP